MARYKKYIPTPPLPKLTEQAKSYQVISTFLAQKTNKENIARLAKDLKDKGNFAEVKEAFRSLSEQHLYMRVLSGETLALMR